MFTVIDPSDERTEHTKNLITASKYELHDNEIPRDDTIYRMIASPSSTAILKGNMQIKKYRKKINNKGSRTLFR